MLVPTAKIEGHLSQSSMIVEAVGMHVQGARNRESYLNFFGPAQFYVDVGFLVADAF